MCKPNSGDSSLLRPSPIYDDLSDTGNTIGVR
jgi:hypothetical protein